jgi:hypothetical protein
MESVEPVWIFGWVAHFLTTLRAVVPEKRSFPARNNGTPALEPSCLLPDKELLLRFP